VPGHDTTRFTGQANWNVFRRKRPRSEAPSVDGLFRVGRQGVRDRRFPLPDLRHTFATRLRAANVHEYDIADLLGHSTTPSETRNTKVTRGYARGVPQRLRDAVESLEAGKRLISGTPTLRQVARGA
jgi:integrase